MYRNSNKPYSNSLIEWLEFVAFQTKSVIRHALSHGGEKTIHDKEFGKTYFVDGFCDEKNIVYEFYGCLYHGCPTCYDINGELPFHKGRKMSDVYNDTIKRERRLQEMGFELKTIWEHDYKRLKQSPEMQHYLNTFEVVTDLSYHTTVSMEDLSKHIN